MNVLGVQIYSQQKEVLERFLIDVLEMETGLEEDASITLSFQNLEFKITQEKKKKKTNASYQKTNLEFTVKNKEELTDLQKKISFHNYRYKQVPSTLIPIEEINGLCQLSFRDPDGRVWLFKIEDELANK
jgi:hypothetical protein